MSCAVVRAGLALLLALAAPLAAADPYPPLRIGVGAADSAPVALWDADGKLVGGLTRDIGDAIAAQLGSHAQYHVVARQRLEAALERGEFDMVCNANPRWFGNAARLGWTRELYPQIERVVTRRERADISAVEQLAGQTVSTVLGFHYPPLEPLWQAGRAERQSEARYELMLRALRLGLADAAIHPELEYYVWAKANPQQARELKLHSLVFTRLPTMCAVAPESGIPLLELNRAIKQLARSGKLAAILARYR